MTLYHRFNITPREQQVVELTVEGLTNHEIAARLGMADRTVKTHLTRIFDKLKLRNRTELVAYMLRRGRTVLREEARKFIRHVMIHYFSEPGCDACAAIDRFLEEERTPPP